MNEETEEQGSPFFMGLLRGKLMCSNGINNPKIINLVLQQFISLDCKGNNSANTGIHRERSAKMHISLCCCRKIHRQLH